MIYAETWRPVINYENLYQVSNYGRVKSLRHIDRRGRKIVGRVLKPGKSGVGYFTVCLWRNEKPKSYLVHRLVAETYIENPLKKSQVNHIDRNKLNNHVDNLEWTTPSENTRHALSKKICQSDLDGNIIRVFDCMTDVNLFGFDKKCVSSVIRRNKSKTSHGYRWDYAK